MQKAAVEQLVEDLKAMEPAEGSTDIPDDKIAGVLQTKAHPVWQSIHDRGHAGATAKRQSEIERLTAERDTAKREADEARDKLEEERKKQPDSATIRAQYEEQERTLKKKHEEREAALNSRIESLLVENAQSDLVRSLKAQGVDEDYATVLAAKPEVRARLKADAEESTVEVLQRGKEIPFAPADGQTGVDLLAAELRPDVPAKFVVSKADTGSSTTGGGGGGGTGSFDFDAHRKKLKEEREESRKEGDTAAKRMGLS